MNYRVVILPLVILVCVYSWFRNREVTHPPGVLVANEPEQTQINEPIPLLKYKNAELEFLAEYSIQARILSIENYYLGLLSKISPVDLALGWGSMSDTAVLRHFKINQGDRFYFYMWKSKLPISEEQIVTSSANVHIIPANKSVEKMISHFRKGQIIKLSGKLVNLKMEDGESHKSSLIRTDRGPGACEILYVERAEAI